jgi:hypothetical protein
MKKVKFAAAFLALAFVIIGSAFTTKPVGTTFGFIGKTNISGSSDKWYELYELTDPRFEVGCSQNAGPGCFVTIDLSNQISGSVQASSIDATYGIKYRVLSSALSTVDATITPTDKDVEIALQ